MALAYDYYPAVLFTLQKIGEGMLPTKALKAANITYAIFKSYIENDRQLQIMAEEAKQQGHDTLADLLLDINDPDSLYGSSDPKIMKVMSDNIKWLLARRDQARYGEKLEIKQEVTLSFVITDALDRARERSQKGMAVADGRVMALEDLRAVNEEDVDLAQFLLPVE